MRRQVVTGAGVVAAVGGALLVAFAIAFRTKFAPVQDVVRRFNRDVTNPKQLVTAGQPGAYASVVHHVGRGSGTPYRTPVVAVPHDDGFLFALPYGAGADWVRNLLAANGATIDHEGRTTPVDRPALLSRAEANPAFPPREQWMHRLFGVDDFLRVRVAQDH